MSLGVARFKRKSLVRGKEESAGVIAERKHYVRSMMEERANKFDDTTLTVPVIGEDNKIVTYKDKDGRTVPVREPISLAYELARSIEVAAHGWNLGKKYPVDKVNVQALKELVGIAHQYEQDLGINDESTKWILGRLQIHGLTLWPRSNTYDAKEIDMVEAPASADDVLKQLAQRLGLGVPIATDLSRQQQSQQQEEAD
jgi:hypothetical protein